MKKPTLNFTILNEICPKHICERCTCEGCSVLSIWVKDKFLHYIYVNQVFETITGYSPNEALGHTAMDLYPEAMAVLMHANDRLVLETGFPMEFIEQIRDKEGKFHYTITNLTPINNPDKEQLLVGMVYDVTPLVLQANEARDRPPYNVQTLSPALA